MDLTALGNALALREEAFKAELEAEGPVFPDISSVRDRDETMPELNLPGEKLAAALMRRAVALYERASDTTGNEDDRSSRAAVVELLKAASAALPRVTESYVAAYRTDAPEEGDVAEVAAAETPRLATVKKRGPRQKQSAAPKKKTAPTTRKGKGGTKKKP